MLNSASVLLITIMAGVAITLQGHFMGLMTRIMGTRESVFITYASGGILIMLIMLFSRGGNLREWREVPWYAFTAGVLGLIIVGSIGFVVPRLGLVSAFTLMVAVQFITAAVIDHFGLFGSPVRPIDLSRIAGLVLLLAGVRLIVH
jgi:bacterial/archaeal transporter family-2 protein